MYYKLLAKKMEVDKDIRRIRMEQSKKEHLVKMNALDECQKLVLECPNLTNKEIRDVYKFLKDMVK